MRTIFLGWTLILLPLSARALEGWSFAAPVKMPEAEQGLVEIPLTDEVFDRARPDLADLRLVAENGKIVPFVLRSDSGGEAGALVEPEKRLNPVSLPGRESSITLDFGRRLRKDGLVIGTEGTDFRRRVRVEASEDGERWQVLRAGAWLFRVGDRAFEQNFVPLPENDFRFLRATVFHGPDDPGTLVFSRLAARAGKVNPAELTAVPVMHASTREPAGQKRTEVLLDLGNAHLPVRELGFEFADADFFRRASLSGRNVTSRRTVERIGGGTRERVQEEPWTPILAGSLHRFSAGGEKDEQLILRLPAGGSGWRHLRLEIENGDDAPLIFRSATARRLVVRLAFAAGAGPCRLHVGNADAAALSHDFAAYADRLRGEGVAEGRLGALEPEGSPEAAPALPWSERHRGLVWAALLLVVAVLGLLIRRSLRPPD